MLRRMAVLYNDQSNVSLRLSVIVSTPSRNSEKKSGSSQQNNTLSLLLVLFFNIPFTRDV